MVRNSADHIESPEDRLAAGNQKRNNLLNAYHEGGHIIMEIKDDGKGLNTARIRESVGNGGNKKSELHDAKTNQPIHLRLVFRLRPR